MSRILVLCYEYPPIGGGGGRAAAQVAAALVERDHQVRVVTAGMPHLPRYEVLNGVEVIRVRARRRREDTCTVLEMLLWVMGASPVALLQAWRWRPEVIHAHFAVPTGAVAWLVHQLTRIPYVLTAHLGDVPGGVPEQTEQLFKKIKWLTIPIWKGAAQVTAVSSFVAELVQKAYGIKARVILNGVRLPKQQPKKQNEVPILLLVGRLSVQKNPLLAIQALGLLRENLPSKSTEAANNSVVPVLAPSSIHYTLSRCAPSAPCSSSVSATLKTSSELPWALKIIGDGPLSAAAHEEVKRLHLQDRISFLGWLSAEEVRQVMERADLLLMPSLSEGLPMVGVEALGYGLAIVGSHIGGLQDILIEGTNGAFFELAAGASGMAKALRPFLENRELLNTAQQASWSHAAAFEWSHSVDLYEKMIFEAANR
ncbi:MAG: glycosyltransferase family 4 protein [Verrucomicrobiae bacterium]|nr:glycosyltransferase family 4 protein [Verrucomicrobiae bacterium]